MFSVADFGSRQPVPYASSHLAHDTTRAELIEIQKADLGRKYARVDRRPLDPPPVVLMKLFHVLDPGTEREAEREISNYDDVQNVGLICTVDLFPVPGPGSDSVIQRDERHSSSSGTSTPSGRSYTGSDGRYPSGSLPPQSVMSAFEDETDPSEVVHYVNNFAVVEGSKVTGALVGQLVAQPHIVEYRGKKALVFVFADLAVKTEGNFILRYRVFDIYASACSADNRTVKMQAECYGGPFRVYSTKEFPGLQASTELTKHLARWGVRLNIRETERRRRKKEPVSKKSPYTTKAMKRKWPDGREGRDHDDDDYDSGGD